MTAADRQRAAVERIRAGRASRSVEKIEDDPQVPAPSSYVRTDPVRHTVDLAPTRTVGLEEWTNETSVGFGMVPGRRGVSKQVVLAKLVELLLTDETTARRARKLIAEHYGFQ